MFEDLSKSLKDNSEKAMGLREKQLKISTAAQAVVQQISDREKITILEKGTTHMSHAIVKKLIRLIVSTSLCWGVMVDDFQGVSICKGNDRYVSDIV